jgi:hypothetical protein
MCGMRCAGVSAQYGPAELCCVNLSYLLDGLLASPHLQYAGSWRQQTAMVRTAKAARAAPEPRFSGFADLSKDVQPCRLAFTRLSSHGMLQEHGKDSEDTELQVQRWDCCTAVNLTIPAVDTAYTCFSAGATCSLQKRDGPDLDAVQEVLRTAADATLYDDTKLVLKIGSPIRDIIYHIEGDRHVRGRQRGCCRRLSSLTRCHVSRCQ